MENWRNIRSDIQNIFEHDYVHYYKDVGCIEIVGKTFISDELVALYNVTNKYHVWYYIEANNGGNIKIRVVDY